MTTPTPQQATTPPTPAADDAHESPGRRTRLRALTSGVSMHPMFAVVLGLVVLLVVFTAVNGTAFASLDNTRNMLLDVSITLVLAVGVTFAIVTAGFDLSVGSVLVFAGVVAMKTMVWFGGGGWATSLLGLLVALLAGTAWGAANGAFVAYASLNPIIVTLGSMGAALGLALVISGGQDQVDVPEVMIGLGTDRFLGVPPVALIALAFAAVCAVVLAKTVFGRHTYAIGSSKESAGRAGLPVRRHLLTVYMLSGFASGLAGWLALARFSTTNMSGHSLDSLDAATAALLGGASLYGGVGSVLGTVVGAFIPVALANGLVIANVQSYWQQVMTGAVLILAIYLDRERRRRQY